MSLVFKYLGQFFRFLFKNARFLPGSFAGLFVAWNFVSDLFSSGVVVAFVNLSKSLFSAELVINENVHLAILDSPLYNFTAFMNIVVSLLILWLFVKWLSKLMIKSFGANENFGAYIWALIIIFLIEIATVKFIDGTFGFIPVRDGLWFLFMNISPVLANVFGSSAVRVVSSAVNVSKNNASL